MFLAALVSVLGLSMAAQAASLTVVADAASYNVGDTITLTVSGSAAGSETATDVFGRLLFNSSLAGAPQSAVQSQLVSFGGFVMWATGALNAGAGSQVAFNQIGGLSPLPISNTLTSTITLTALAAGVVNVAWEIGNGLEPFSWFGLTNAAGTSFTINAVPEPTTASLLGLGLVGLTLAGRRRRS